MQIIGNKKTRPSKVSEGYLYPEQVFPFHKYGPLNSRIYITISNVLLS